MDELTSTLGGLCQDYRIPVDSEALPHLDTYLRMLRNTETSANQNLEQEDEQELQEEEEEFHTFCQSHTYLMGTNCRQLGYSTMPLPPNRGERKALPPATSHPKRSQSYEGHHMRAPGHYATSSYRHHSDTRNSYPQSFGGHDNKTYSYYDNTLGHRVSRHHPRPLSYQEISYDENDYEENFPNENWSELSCP